MRHDTVPGHFHRQILRPRVKLHLKKCSSNCPDAAIDSHILPAQGHFSLSRHADCQDLDEFSGLIK